MHGYLNRWAVPADQLSDITNQLRLSDLFCGIVRATPPYGRSAPKSDSFHVFLMTHGQMYLEAIEGATDAPILLDAGDILIMSRGSRHRFVAPLDVPRSLETDLAPVDHASPPHTGEIEYIGMMCYLDRAHRNLLTDCLPPVIHIRRDTPGLATWLQPTVELFRAAYRERFRADCPTRSLGSGAVLTRLAEMVCVQALRTWIERAPPEMRGWLIVLKDKRIALALQAIHDCPERRWTVDALAHRAGMSRSVFSERFKALVGESPMGYVSRWRMQCAAGLLEQDAANLKSVMQASGYKSAATFRAHFKRQFGVLPHNYRRK